MIKHAYLLIAAASLAIIAALNSAPAANKEIGPAPMHKITVVGGDNGLIDGGTVFTRAEPILAPRPIAAEAPAVVLVPWAIKADVTVDGEVSQTLVFNIDEGKGFGKRVFKDEADCLAYLAAPDEIFTTALDGLKTAVAFAERGAGVVTIRCATDAPSQGI